MKFKFLIPILLVLLFVSCQVDKAIVENFTVVYPTDSVVDSSAVELAPKEVTINGVTYGIDFHEDFTGSESEKKERLTHYWDLSEVIASTSLRMSDMIDCTKSDFIELQTKPVKFSELNEEQKKVAAGATRYLNDEYVLGCAEMKSKTNYKYGYIEARIKISKKTKGHWYYFYTIGSTDLIDGQGSYEYDVIEQTSITDSYQAVAHWTQTSPKYKTYPKTNFFLESENITEWHRYGLLWTEQNVIYYLDGVPVFAFDSTGKGTPKISYEPLGFNIIADVPMSIKLGNTIANGTSIFELWIGAKIDVEEMLVNGTDAMSVDYIARYKTDDMTSMMPLE